MSQGTESTAGDVGGGALTLTRRDILQIQQNATRGRPLTAEERAKSIACLTEIIDDPKSARRTKITATRALTALESLDLRDLHHTERLKHEDGVLDLRYRRADEGKPDQIIEHQFAPVRELPLPASLSEYRKKILEPGKN